MFKKIFEYAGPYKKNMYAATVVVLVSVLMGVLPFVLAYQVIAPLVMGESIEASFIILRVVLVLACLVLQALFYGWGLNLSHKAAYDTLLRLRTALQKRFEKLPLGVIQDKGTGTVKKLFVDDVDSLEVLLAHSMPEGIANLMIPIAVYVAMFFVDWKLALLSLASIPISLIAMMTMYSVAMSTLGNMMSYLLSSLVLLAFMFYLNWQLGLIAAIVTILAWLVSKGMNKVSLREAAGRQEQSERLTDAVLSFVEGIGVIKSYNLLGEKSEELSGNFKRSRNTSLDFERKMTPWTMGLNILYGIGIAAIFGLSIVLEQSGALSLAYVLGVLLFVFDLFGPLKALYGEASRLTVMNAALDRIEAVLDEPELSDNGKQHIPAQAQPGQPEVLFNDVTFAYQDKEVLHHISFAMKKNSMTALVGPSGSGKSTIANLLARLWDVKSGNVTIRGVDIRNVPLSELMDQISMVFQRVYLFQDTIYNNIIMGKPDATEEEVYEAARKARCYDFIMALPDGFQTVVGEGGATLSGGEKQRISIARCILKDAPIVILDEATASVDTDNESYIQEAISELVKGKTLLVIAHRLNTIRQADQILVIDNGQIAQQGTHEELLKQPGIYQDFVNIRKSAAGWSLA